MNDAQNGNGNPGGMVTISPADKFILLKVNDASKNIEVIASNGMNEIDVTDILWVAMTQAINTLKEKAKANPPGRIITLPPGSTIRPRT